MQSNNKLCFAFYVWGEKYYEYIPLCLYFIGKSHPQAFTVVSCREVISDNLRLRLTKLSNQRFRIDENVFSDYPGETRLTLRWVMTPDEYYKYEYIYIGDIDLFITSTKLLRDHQNICDTFNIPYSNTDKIDFPQGLQLTGLHFFKSKPYLDVMIPIIRKYRILLQCGMPVKFQDSHTNICAEQKSLRVMVKESGLPMPEHVFFKYHGLHLGHSRCPQRWEMFFSIPDEEHITYFKEFMFLSNNDEYRRLYLETPREIKFEIDTIVSAWKAKQC